MKIIRIVDGYAYPSTIGPNAFIHVLSTELAKRGHQNIVFSTMTGKEVLLTGETNGYVVKNYKVLFRLWSFPVNPKLIIDVLRERPDIIHVRGYRSFPSEFAAWLMTFRKIPYVLSPHGSLLAYKYLTPNRLSRALHGLYDTLTFKFALAKAARIAVTSGQEANEALEIGIPQDRIRVMPHAENLADMNIPAASPHPVHRILAVGRVDPIQNWHTLIKAFAIVVKQVPDAQLILVGPSQFSHTHMNLKSNYQQRLFKLCRELNLTDRVIFTGPVYGEELKNAYTSSGIFVYIIPYGCYGRTHIEAAAFGKPIVSTPVGIVPDLVGDNEGGFLVEPYDTEGIARAIISLLSDTHLYQAKQKAILERVKKYLDVKLMVDEYEKLYEEIIS